MELFDLLELSKGYKEVRGKVVHKLAPKDSNSTLEYKIVNGRMYTGRSGYGWVQPHIGVGWLDNVFTIETYEK